MGEGEGARHARRGIFGFLLSAATVCASPSFAAYPERPLKIIVPFAPGGANDLIARIISVPLGQALGQTVIVENRGGANGNIGIAAAARAEPDGYTLLVSCSRLIRGCRNPPPMIHSRILRPSWWRRVSRP